MISSKQIRLNAVSLVRSYLLSLKKCLQFFYCILILQNHPYMKKAFLLLSFYILLFVYLHFIFFRSKEPPISVQDQQVWERDYCAVFQGLRPYLLIQWAPEGARELQLISPRFEEVCDVEMYE